MRQPTNILCVAAAMLAASPALAVWAPDGNPIVAVAGDQYGIAATAFGAGGVLVAWEDARAGESTTDIYAKALTRDGLIVEGWPADGLPVCTVDGLQRYVSVMHDAAGAYVAWLDLRSNSSAVYLQRVTSGGTIAGTWPENGLKIGTDASPIPFALAADGTGGAFIGWVDVSGVQRIQRITPGAVPSPAWPEQGIALGAAEGGAIPALSADDAGGVFVAWFGPRGSTERPVNVLRLGPDGSVHPSWPAAGVHLGDERAFLSGGLTLLPDHLGGQYVGWYDMVGVCPVGFGCGGNQELVGLDGTGQVRAGWPSTGLKVGPAGSITGDGSGGVLYSWEELPWLGRIAVPPYAFPRVSRLDWSGRLHDGWLGGGNPVCTEDGYQYGLRVLADGAGGAFLGWVDSRTHEGALYMSRLDASANVARGWPVTGSIGAPGARAPEELVLVDVGEGRAIAVWVERRSGSRDVFADIVVAGPPGPPAPLANVFDRPVEFEIIQVRPNPTPGSFWAVIGLPETGRTTLDLLDLAGRVVESTSLDPGGAARGAVRFNASDRLAPGVYWLRIRQGTRVASTRVVVAH